MYITNGCTYVHNKKRMCTQQKMHMYTKVCTYVHKKGCMYVQNKWMHICTQKGCLYIYIYTNICVCLFDYYQVKHKFIMEKNSSKNI